MPLQYLLCCIGVNGPSYGTSDGSHPLLHFSSIVGQARQCRRILWCTEDERGTFGGFGAGCTGAAGINAHAVFVLCDVRSFFVGGFGTEGGQDTAIEGQVASFPLRAAR